MSAGDTIKKARESRGISQEDLAKAAGVSQKQISNVENGENTSVDFLGKVAAVLGLKEIPITSSLSVTASVPITLSNGSEVVAADSQLIGVPIHAYVAAGHGGWDDATDRELVALPPFLIGSNDFVVQAKGESMIDENIHDGDLLIVERRPNGIAAHGELVIAWLNDGLLIKRWFRRNGRKVLESANEEMGWKPREITPDDVFEIQGVVRYIIKNAKRIS